MSNEPELALKLELKLALEPLAAFGVTAVPPEPDRPRYTYSGLCPTTGARLTLPRSALAEAVARGLMARLAMGEAQEREGKMYGVLVVQTAAGEVGVLKAFSGLLQGQAVQPGWVPPIPGREAVAGSEAETLAQLTAIGQELAQIAQDPAWQTLATLEQTYQARRHSLHHQHQQAKADRQHQRQQWQATVPEPQLGEALAALDRQSQQEGIQRRKLKQEQDAALAPLRAKTQDLADRRLALRRDRTRLSRQLQAQMHATYALTNFAGRSQSLLEIVQNQGIPTGTGECCAPKLLHFAASAGLRPLGLAEFWWERGEVEEVGGVGEVGEEAEVEEWGSSRQRRSGQFYGACRERCQPIMGFLLSGLGEIGRGNPPVVALVSGRDKPPVVDPVSGRGNPPVVDPVFGRDNPPVVDPVSGRGHPPVVDPILAMVDPPLGHSKPEPIRILYQDPWLIVVDKPAGLLSVPGRRQWDSVVSRLRCGLGLERTIGAENEPDGPEDLRAVHRLDQDTSGVLVIARDRASHRHLSQQFHDRRIEKIYFAIVRGQIQPQSGTIDLPLWGDPQQRPRQVVHNQRGKPSQTQYQVQEIFPYHGQTYSRLELRPQTGRTHQLRVHLADPLGLGSAIVGDRLYGNSPSHDRQPPDRLGNAAVTEAATTPAQQPWGDRLHLHAHRLSFTHPHTGQPLEITAPPPRSI